MSTTVGHTRSTAITSHDLVSIITNDHAQVRSLHAEYKAAGDAAHKQKLMHEMIKLLSVHAACEEMVSYPAISKYVKVKGEATAKHSIEEHREMKKDLYQLDQMKIDDPLMESTLHKVMQEFYHHANEEETKVLPELAGSISSEELIKLGESFTSHKSIAPTRPHPEAPDSYPTNVAVNTATKPIDELRDEVRERQDDRAIKQAIKPTPPTA